MQSFQASGDLVNLSEWINVDQIEQDYSSVVDLAEVDGNIYGLFFKADLKSIVWYPVRAFEDAGYTVPTTWDELMALQDQIKADGGTPWCIGMEHGDATGWVATDWIEDVLLRTAPVEVYDQWVAHEIPFNSPEVLEAAEIVSQIWFDDGNVFGGNTAINNVFVGHAMNDMFARPEPKCWLHKQASWIPSFWPGAEEDPPDPQFEPGVDSTFFYLPPIDEEFGNPVLGGADMIVMFNDRPEVRALLEYLATPEAPLPWIEVGGFVSPNQSVPDSAYTTFPSSGLGPILSQATTLRFDASDAMPAEVGQGTFWSGMVDWVSDEGQNTEQIFQQIEESWPSG
jgi:alpha-glucoside transport system substrate-binding protein